MITITPTRQITSKGITAEEMRTMLAAIGETKVAFSSHTCFWCGQEASSIEKDAWDGEYKPYCKPCDLFLEE